MKKRLNLKLEWMKNYDTKKKKKKTSSHAQITCNEASFYFNTLEIPCMTVHKSELKLKRLTKCFDM